MSRSLMCAVLVLWGCGTPEQSPEGKAVIAAVESAAIKNAVYWQEFLDSYDNATISAISANSTNVLSQLTEIDANIKGIYPALEIPVRTKLAAQIDLEKDVVRAVAEQSTLLMATIEATHNLDSQDNSVAKASMETVKKNTTQIESSIGSTLTTIDAIDATQKDLKTLLPSVVLVTHEKCIATLKKLDTEIKTMKKTSEDSLKN